MLAQEAVGADGYQGRDQQEYPGLVGRDGEEEQQAGAEDQHHDRHAGGTESGAGDVTRDSTRATREGEGVVVRKLLVVFCLQIVRAPAVRKAPPREGFEETTAILPV